MPCTKLAACPFFNDRMPMEKGLGALYKKNYCDGEYGKCARYQVSEAMGKEKVPSNLYPNQAERVGDILAGKP